MKAYDNYIFDLYGTLADIHTEENDPLVWKKLALFYGYYDADYIYQSIIEKICCPVFLPHRLKR